MKQRNCSLAAFSATLVGVHLDPEIADWVDRYPPPDIDPRDIAAVRSTYDAYMADRGGPQPLQSHPDVRLESARVGDVGVLIWSPLHPRRAPVVIAMHGGAFVVGHPLGAERIAVPLAAQHGIITVSVAYRLSPEHRAPDALDDCMTVLMGIFGTESDRVAVHGSSAGACLAAGLALRARDAGIPLALQSLSCPALDPGAMRAADASHSAHGPSPTLSRASVEAMWEHYLGEGIDDPPMYAAPALAPAVEGVAPAHVVVAEYDVLRDEGLAYAFRLSAAGVPATVERFGGTVHGFDGLLPDSSVGRRSIETQVNALAQALLG